MKISVLEIKMEGKGVKNCDWSELWNAVKESQKVRTAKGSIALAATKILVSVEKVNSFISKHYLFHVRERKLHKKINFRMWFLFETRSLQM